MANGQLKWFNSKKGYGAIQSENSMDEIALHASELQLAGLSDLREGQRLSFEVVMKENKETAVNVKLADSTR